MDIDSSKYYIIDVDNNDKIVLGPHDTSDLSETAAVRAWGEHWWTNETPYTMRQGKELIKS